MDDDTENVLQLLSDILVNEFKIALDFLSIILIQT